MYNNKLGKQVSLTLSAKEMPKKIRRHTWKTGIPVFEENVTSMAWKGT